MWFSLELPWQPFPQGGQNCNANIMAVRVQCARYQPGVIPLPCLVLHEFLTSLDQLTAFSYHFRIRCSSPHFPLTAHVWFSTFSNSSNFAALRSPSLELRENAVPLIGSSCPHLPLVQTGQTIQCLPFLTR